MKNKHPTSPAGLRSELAEKFRQAKYGKITQLEWEQWCVSFNRHRRTMEATIPGDKPAYACLFFMWQSRNRLLVECRKSRPKKKVLRAEQKHLLRLKAQFDEIMSGKEIKLPDMMHLADIVPPEALGGMIKDDYDLCCKVKFIKAADYPEWPFTVEHGTLVNDHGAVLFDCDNGLFGLTGLARAMGFEKIDRIWVKRDVGHVPLTDVINEGLRL